MLQNYLNDGGKVLLTTSIYDETPNLDAVMAQFGLSREPGIVVEVDSGHSLYGYPYSLFPDYAATEESAALDGVNKDTHVMLSVAQGHLHDRDGGCDRGTACSNHSEQSYSKQDVNNAASTAKESGDTDGPFYAGRLGMQRLHRGRSDLDRLPEHGQRAGVSVHSRATAPSCRAAPFRWPG